MSVSSFVDTSAPSPMVYTGTLAARAAAIADWRVSSPAVLRPSVRTTRYLLPGRRIRLLIEFLIACQRYVLPRATIGSRQSYRSFVSFVKFWLIVNAFTAC